jgi:hypothetical protein
MGLTQKLGTIPLAILTDSSNNVGIGAAANASFKLQVTGATNLTGALSGTSATFNSLTLNSGNAVLNTYFQTGTSAGWDVNTFFTGGNTGAEISLNLGYAGATTDTFIKRGSNGRLDLGTAATARLSIASTGAATFSSAVILNGTGVSAGTSTYLQFNNNGTAIGYVGSAAAINGGASTSVTLGVASGAGLTIASTGAATFTGNIAIQKTAGILLLGNSTTNSYGVVQFLGNASGQGNTLGELDFYNKISGTDVLSGQIEIAHDGTTADNKSYMALRVHNGSSLLTPLYITSGGNVFFGKTTDDDSIAGMKITQVGLMTITRDSNNTAVFRRNGSNGTIMTFNYAGTTVGSISTNTNSLPSDYNFKKDITNISLGLNLINKLRPVNYRHKIDNDNEPLSNGIIAQELEQALLECGFENNSLLMLQHIPNEKEGESQYWVDYTKMIPILVKAIQEQQAQIEELKALINK